MLMRLKELRICAGEKQERIAQMLNVRQSTYSQYESGVHEIPLDTLITLARHYDVSLDYIVGLTDIEAPFPAK